MAGLIKAAKKGDNAKVVYHLVAGADVDFVNVVRSKATHLILTVDRSFFTIH